MNTIRLSVDLEARMDAAYESDYHNNVRGRVSNALQGTQFADEHDKNMPLGMCFSAPFPPGELSAGDQRNITFSATREDLLIELAKDFKANPEFNVGEMPFTVTGLSKQEADVGPVGTTGVIRSDSGILVRFAQEECEEYGITPRGNSRVFWKDSQPVSAFRKGLTRTLQAHWDKLESSPDGPGPDELYEPVFSGFDLRKEYAIPLTVTHNETRTLVLTKWEFEYTVQSPAHRDVLNFALATGLGARNNYGLGFSSITEKRTPDGPAANHPPKSSSSVDS